MSYLRDLAEAIRARVPSALIPDDSDDLFVLYAVLVRVKGRSATVEDIHDAWTAWKEIRGESHQSMVPFSELDATVRAKDTPFHAAVLAVAEAEGS